MLNNEEKRILAEQIVQETLKVDRTIFIAKFFPSKDGSIRILMVSHDPRVERGDDEGFSPEEAKDDFLVANIVSEREWTEFFNGEKILPDDWDLSKAEDIPFERRK